MIINACWVCHRTMSAAAPAAALDTAPSPVLGRFVQDGGGLASHSDCSKPKGRRLLCKQCAVWQCVLLFSVHSPAGSSWMQNATGQKQQPCQRANMSRNRGARRSEAVASPSPRAPHSLGACCCTCVCTVSWPKSGFGGHASWPATPSPSQAVANYALRLNCLEPLETCCWNGDPKRQQCLHLNAIFAMARQTDSNSDTFPWGDTGKKHFFFFRGVGQLGAWLGGKSVASSSRLALEIFVYVH